MYVYASFCKHIPFSAKYLSCASVASPPTKKFMIINFIIARLCLPLGKALATAIAPK